MRSQHVHDENDSGDLDEIHTNTNDSNDDDANACLCTGSEYLSRVVRHSSLTSDAAVTNRAQTKKAADALHPPSLMTTASTTTTTLPWTTTIIDNNDEESECARD